MIPVCELDWAWLAGFIDGEGNIGIYEERDSRKGSDYSHPRPTLQIVNTHLPSIGRCWRIVGGGGFTLVRDGHHKHKPQYRLHVRNASLLKTVMEKTAPYLITRRRQAELMREFVAGRLALRGRGRYAAFTPRDRELIQEIRALNARAGC